MKEEDGTAEVIQTIRLIRVETKEISVFEIFFVLINDILSRNACISWRNSIQTISTLEAGLRSSVEEKETFSAIGD